MSSAERQQNDEQHEVTLDEALELARGHHTAGNYILAERTYRDILRAVPDHFPTTHLLGVLLFQAGNYDDAKMYIGKALEKEPENPHCLSNYGGILAQTGQYEEALEYYDRSLAINPENIEALGNKISALWKLERYQQAEEVCNKTLKIDPKNPLALNSLGMILVKRVKYEEALEAWEEAAEISPEEVTIWCNWGNALREMGRLREALEKCEKALEINPEHPESLSNAANVYREMGRSEKAVELYIKATNERPEYYEAHSNLAIAYTDLGLFEKAAVSARYALAFKPDFIDAYAPLCQGLCEMGDLEKAHMYAQRAIHVDPEKAETFLSLASVLLRLDQHADAEAAVSEALKLEPDSARAYLGLAQVRDRMNNFEGALEAVNQGLEISPDHVTLQLKKGQLYFGENKIEEAHSCIDKALELAPENGVALNQKAEAYLSTNHNEEALKIVRKMIRLEANLVGAYMTLASLKKFKSTEDEDFIEMKKLEETVHQYGTSTALGYYFCLSDVYEQVGEYDKAFEYLKKANDIRLKAIPRKAEDRVTSPTWVKKRYTKELVDAFTGKGCKSDIPVFIVGMPRSGTTLTEQILAAHPDVFGAGELREITDLTSAQSLSKQASIEELGETYVRNVKQRDPSGKAKRITDKMPANFMHLGFIRSILPEAKIIHCRRNPIDTCLSCYKQNFANGQYWSYDLDDLATEYENYLEIMEHYRQIMPGGFLEIDYEETVGNPEAQARKLIDFIGLEWNDACLEPHKQKRAILTASKGQVTRPIYKTSVEKWRRYEKYLEPLVKRLAPEKL